MLTNLQIDGRYDAAFIRDLAGIPANDVWGGSQPGAAPDTQVILFDDSFAEAITDAINGYDAAWLVKAKAETLEAIAEVRRQKELIGPGGLTLDDKTVSRLTAAAVGLMIDTNREGVRWEITRGQFVTMPRAQVLGLAVAAVDKVQACFDRVSDLTDAVNAAADLTALEAIDIDDGWPA